MSGIWEVLAPSAALIVLDNCEHVVEAVAGLCTELLRTCPDLRVLATSREPVGVPGEVLWPVPPLEVPPDGTADPEALAQCEAVQLFVERAAAAVPAFQLDEVTAGAVTKICRRLDGLPLAIELAVASLRMLPVTKLAESLDDVFRLLVGGARTAPARHQTLRATLDWSHRLLEAEERAALRRLSVFVGPFTLEAATAVAFAPDEAGRAFDLLRRLVDKSLVAPETFAGEPYFRLLATVRQYAAEQLAGAGEEAAYKDAHLRWCVARAAHAEVRLTSSMQAAELERLETEVNDLRAGLHFARETGQAGTALQLASSLVRYWYLHGHYQEGRDWLDWALVAGDDEPEALRAKAFRASGRLALLQCDYQAATRRLSAALRIFDQLDDSAGKAATLQVLGSVAREQGRYQQAEAHHRESLELCLARQDLWGEASSRGYLGFVAWLQGDLGRAREECRQALQLFRQLGDSEGIAWSLLSLGVVAQYQDDLAEATKLLRESQVVCDKIGFQEGIAWCLNQLGVVALREGSLEEGERLLRASIEVHRELGDQWRLTSVVDELAAVCAQKGDHWQAARLLGAGDAARSRIGTPVPVCERPRRGATASLVEQALGEAAYRGAFEAGGATSLEELLGRRPSPEIRLSGDGAGGAPSVRLEQGTAPGRDQQLGGPKRATGTGRHGNDGRAAESFTLSIRALGTWDVQVGERRLGAPDWGYSKPRELFFLLCSSPPRTREQLGLALWPDLSGNGLRNALHTALRDLRRAIGDRDWVVFADGRYSFNRTRPHDYDVSEFEAAMAAARRSPGPHGFGHLQRALALYKGDFLSGSAAGEWAEERRRELRALFELALGATGAVLTKAGKFRQASQIYERAVAHDPLDETSHRELMKCWISLGEPARAARHYEGLVGLLEREVGTKPAPETLRLYEKARSAR